MITQESELLINSINLLEKFYSSNISASKFGINFEKLWKKIINNNLKLHPIYEIHLFRELYLDYDSYRKKPDYKDYQINEIELKSRCLEVIKAFVLLNPLLKNRINSLKILSKIYSINEIKKRLSKNGRIFLLSKLISGKKAILNVIWITFNINTKSYFVSIEKWPVKFNEKKERHPQRIEYGFTNLKSLLNYLDNNKYI